MKFVIVLMAGSAAMIAGCGGSSGGSAGPPPYRSSVPTVTKTVTSAPSGASTAATSSAPATQACRTTDLAISLGRGQGAAGTDLQPLLFRNRGRRPCTVAGYPGVSFADGGARQVGHAARRRPVPSGKSAASVTLAPGAVASAQLSTVNTQGPPASACRPADALQLIVYAPDQTDYQKVPIAERPICTTTQYEPGITPIVAGPDPRG